MASVTCDRGFGRPGRLPEPARAIVAGRAWAGGVHRVAVQPYTLTQAATVGQSLAANCLAAGCGANTLHMLELPELTIAAEVLNGRTLGQTITAAVAHPP